MKSIFVRLTPIDCGTSRQYLGEQTSGFAAARPSCGSRVKSISSSSAASHPPVDTYAADTGVPMTHLAWDTRVGDPGAPPVSQCREHETVAVVRSVKPGEVSPETGSALVWTFPHMRRAARAASPSGPARCPQMPIFRHHRFVNPGYGRHVTQAAGCHFPAANRAKTATPHPDRIQHAPPPGSNPSCVHSPFTSP